MAHKVHRNAFTVVDIDSQVKDQKARWTQIGVSFLNNDGSETLLLDALPVNGKIILFDPKKKQPTEDEPPPA